MGWALLRPTEESILLFLLVASSFVRMGSFQCLQSFVSRLRAKEEFCTLDAGCSPRELNLKAGNTSRKCSLFILLPVPRFPAEANFGHPETTRLGAVHLACCVNRPVLR